MHKVDGGIWIWANNNTGVIDHQYMGNNFGELNKSSNEKYHMNINSLHDDGTLGDYNNYSSSVLIRWGGNNRNLAWLGKYFWIF